MDISSQTLTFQPGQTSITWRVAITDDNVYEGNEVYGYRIVSATNASIDMATENYANVREQLGYIIDNDSPPGPTVRFAGPAQTQDVSEGAGFLEHQIVLSEASAQAVTVTIEGPAYRQGDMDISSQTLTFQPGQTSITWRVAITDDSVYEGNEVYGYRIVSATNATVDMSTENYANVREQLGYITDNDSPPGPTVRFAGPAQTQDVSEGAGFLEHEIVLSQASTQVVTVMIEGPAYRQGDMDISTQTLTFQPGQTSITWRVAITDDSVYEGNEVYGYRIVSATNASIDLSTENSANVREQLGYIIDNDLASPSSSPDDNLAAGSGSATLNGGAGNDTIAGGPSSDYLRGDEGDDRITGGDAFDDINGNMGNDTASGGLGDDWVVGGKDQDLMRGDEGGDIVYGNLGDDTCDGGDGADIVRGGQQADVLTGGAGDDWLSGDRDNDTITGGAGADVFHTFGEAGLDRVTDFNRAEGDRVMLDPGTTYTVAQSGADVVITMGGGGQMILVGVQTASLTGDWIFGA
jgi:Ca2+-binding RTX toxin-like protein